MQDLINSIQLSIETNNWYGALLIALVVPDICSRTQYPLESPNKRYPNWFEKYKDKSYEKRLSGFDCYALRCSYVHEGKQVISEQKSREIIDKITFSPSGSHLIVIGDDNDFGGTHDDGKNILHLSVSRFCLDMIESYKLWVRDNTIYAEELKHNMISIVDVNIIGNGAIRIQ